MLRYHFNQSNRVTCLESRTLQKGIPSLGHQGSMLMPVNTSSISSDAPKYVKLPKHVSIITFQLCPLLFFRQARDQILQLLRKHHPPEAYCSQLTIIDRVSLNDR